MQREVVHDSPARTVQLFQQYTVLVREPRVESLVQHWQRYQHRLASEPALFERAVRSDLLQPGDGARPEGQPGGCDLEQCRQGDCGTLGRSRFRRGVPAASRAREARSRRLGGVLSEGLGRV